MIYAIEIDGVITRYNLLPRIWNKANGYRKSASVNQIYNDGFREFIIPILTVYQKKGILIEGALIPLINTETGLGIIDLTKVATIIVDEIEVPDPAQLPMIDDGEGNMIIDPDADIYLLTPENYTYEVIDFTQEEIDNYEQRQLDLDVSFAQEERYVRDGKEDYMRIKARLRRALITEYITQTQFDNIYTPIRTAILDLMTGDWDFAQTKINAINPPAGKLTTIHTAIKKIIDDYLIDNPEF